jgi:uncharacterized protein YjbJ (UPF0337 family)
VSGKRRPDDDPAPEGQADEATGDVDEDTDEAEAPAPDA